MKVSEPAARHAEPAGIWYPTCAISPGSVCDVLYRNSERLNTQ